MDIQFVEDANNPIHVNVSMWYNDVRFSFVILNLDNVNEFPRENDRLVDMVWIPDAGSPFRIIVAGEGITFVIFGSLAITIPRTAATEANLIALRGALVERIAEL